MNTLSSSRRLANAKKENVDPCSRKGEGEEGSDRHQVLMVGCWALCLDAPKISLSRTVPCRVCRDRSSSKSSEGVFTSEDIFSRTRPT